MRRTIIALIVLSAIGLASPVDAAQGTRCTKVGAIDRARGLQCTRKNGRLTWNRLAGSAGKTTQTTTPAMTVSQTQASRSAASYLRVSGFSRTGLISQLEFEGFSNTDATFAVDAQKADWKMQASRSAASYLRTAAFSRTGLISQLEFEGFSNAEAVSGTDAQNADWLAQAARMAASYLRTSSFSRSSLIGQLVFEGFTQAQAEHGANSVGL